MAGTRLALSHQSDDDEVIVLEGDLDAHTASELDRVLRDIPATANRIVLAMPQLDFIDSAGLGVIVNHDRERGPGVLVLRDLNDRVSKVLEYAGLLGHLTIE